MTERLLADARRFIDAALSAVDPHRCVVEALEIDDEHLMVRGARHRLRNGIVGLAIGKAALPMLHGLAEVAGARLLRGLAITKQPGNAPDRCTVSVGDHPFPGPGSFRSAIRAEKLVRETTSDELLVVLLSGGGSALMCAPALDLSTEKLTTVTEQLMRAGAPITDINIVRRRLDRLKGGGLGSMANTRPVALVLSDVVGDDLATVASGPFISDPSTSEEVVAVLERADIEDNRVLSAAHTLLPREPVPTAHHIVGNIATAVDAAASEAAGMGYVVEIVDTALEGEARVAGAEFAARMREYDGTRPAVLLAGGETTVTVTGDGRGGRNLEVALGAVETLAGATDSLMVTFATDGEDGSTGAAGAWVDGNTAKRAKNAGLDAEEHLSRNDSLAFFDAVGELLTPGSTGTNVNDLIIGIVT